MKTPLPVLSVLLFATACLTAGAAPAAARPNIVWIFSDDHSYQTIGAYGGRLQGLDPTPNIDRLAREGMRFDRCYVGNSICAPSRATLLTGKHSHLHGKTDNIGRFDHNQPQVQKLLRAGGYQTAMIGKIHLDGRMQGFDHWDVLPGQGAYYDPEFVSAAGTTQHAGYVTDIITDKALAWLEKERDRDRPFLLMIHHKAPHRNWQPAPRHMELHEGTHIPEPENLFDSYATRATAAQAQRMDIRHSLLMQRDLKIPLPGEAVETERTVRIPDFGAYTRRQEEFHRLGPEGDDLVRWKYQHYMKDFLRCVKAVDENVGRVLDALRELNLEENTIVMYSSDQGFYMGEHGWFDKRFMYEESFRTPLLVRWPGRTTPGSVNQDLVQNIDWAPTFLDLAGLPVPEEMQGVSLVPLFQGEKPADWRKSLYYHYYEYPGAHSVRRHEGVADGRFKLIRFYGRDVPGGEEWELYDLAADPSEMNNRYTDPAMAGRVTAMKQELHRLRIHYKVP